jgi:transposase
MIWGRRAGAKIPARLRMCFFPFDKNVVMAREREAGKELFVDWMGNALGCVIDNETGEILTAHFFVAALGDSNYPYVEAFLDEKLESWLSWVFGKILL